MYMGGTSQTGVGKQSLHEDQVITRYLLGDLDESQSEQIEQRYFCEQDFFEHIGVVEDILISGWLDHLLSARDLELFEKKYLKVPELQEKVAFALTLRARVAWRGTGGIRPSRTRRWRYWFALAAPAFAACGLVFLLAAWLVVGRARRPAVGSAQIEHPGAANQPVAPAATFAGAPAMLSVVLTPGLMKGSGETARRVVLTKEIKEIRLEFDLPGVHEDLPASVELLRAQDERLRHLWSRKGVPSSPTLTGRTVLVSVKPDELPSGDYVVYIRRSGAPPDSEPVESYAMGVVRR